MGTRVLRITGTQIPKKAESIRGQVIQLVTWSGKSYHARLNKVSENHLYLVDVNAFWYNRKKHTHVIPVEETREIIVDQKRDW